MITVRKFSQFTGKLNSMQLPVTKERLLAWANSTALVQDEFPDLTPDQREFLLTGSTPEEWNEFVGPERD